MGMGKAIITVLTVLMISSTGLAALMPLGEGLNASKQDTSAVKTINVMNWIKNQNALLSERSVDMNKFIDLKKIHSDMTEADISRNFFVTTIRNMDVESIKKVTAGIKEVEKVTSAKYVLVDENQNKSELKMGMDLIRAEAKIEYKGTVDAQLRYELNNSQMSLEFSKDYSGTRVLAEHTAHNGEQKNMLGVRWNF